MVKVEEVRVINDYAGQFGERNRGEEKTEKKGLWLEEKGRIRVTPFSSLLEDTWKITLWFTVLCSVYTQTFFFFSCSLSLFLLILMW